MVNNVHCPECGAPPGSCPRAQPLRGRLQLRWRSRRSKPCDERQRVGGDAPRRPRAGWKPRWAEIERDLAALRTTRDGSASAATIHAARHELHSFYVQAYHLKDAMIDEGVTIGLGPDVQTVRTTVEGAINAEPVLALLADLANLEKHTNLNKPPRSGHVPSVLEASASSCGASGWRLDLAIEHGGTRLDGLRVDEDAVAAWRRALVG